MGEDLQELTAALQIHFPGRKSHGGGRTCSLYMRLKSSLYSDAWRCARVQLTLQRRPTAHLPFTTTLSISITSFSAFHLHTLSRLALICSQANTQGREAPGRPQCQLMLRKAPEDSTSHNSRTSPQAVPPAGFVTRNNRTPLIHWSKGCSCTPT